MILNYIEQHLDRQMDYEVLEYWERYSDNTRVPTDGLSTPRAKNMDELYQDCVSDAEGVHYSDTGHRMIYSFRVNREGYVASCGLYNEFLQDGGLEVFNIIKFN
ncbi:MAG: hypothetical protein ACFB15_03685 [Cyclobacteriaceae bacterium]